MALVNIPTHQNAWPLKKGNILKPCFEGNIQFFNAIIGEPNWEQLGTGIAANALSCLFYFMNEVDAIMENLSYTNILCFGGHYDISINKPMTVPPWSTQVYI